MEPGAREGWQTKHSPPKAIARRNLQAHHGAWKPQWGHNTGRILLGRDKRIPRFSLPSVTRGTKELAGSLVEREKDARGKDCGKLCTLHPSPCALHPSLAPGVTPQIDLQAQPTSRWLWGPGQVALPLCTSVSPPAKWGCRGGTTSSLPPHFTVIDCVFMEALSWIPWSSPQPIPGAGHLHKPRCPSKKAGVAVKERGGGGSRGRTHVLSQKAHPESLITTSQQ